MRWSSGHAIGLGLVWVLGGALPLYAQTPTDPRLLVRSVGGLPERGAFQELLTFLAQPTTTRPEGFVTPPLSLAVRSRAVGFVSSDPIPENALWDALGAEAMDMPVSELPGGTQIRTFFRRGPEDSMRLRDLGPLLRSRDGPFRSTLRALLGNAAGAEMVGNVAIAAAVMGAVSKWGTLRAMQLGLAPTIMHQTDDQRWASAATLYSEPNFVNARVDLSTRLKLPELFALGGEAHEEFVEVGITTAGAGSWEKALSSRWAKVRTHTERIDLALGVRSNQGEPFVWSEAELAFREKWFAVQSTVRHAFGTGQLHLLTTLTIQTGSAMWGVYGTVQTPGTRTVGLLAMAVF
jgi:hypothetical protein